MLVLYFNGGAADSLGFRLVYFNQSKRTKLNLGRDSTKLKWVVGSSSFLCARYYSYRSCLVDCLLFFLKKLLFRFSSPYVNDNFFSLQTNNYDSCLSISVF